jgi:prolyl-tRNA editing enzyme YbaK/EbsC (Cys-tRNA(Pro) deacylase)
MGSRTPDEERLKVETVAAEAENTANEIINSVVIAVEVNILVFFIFPLGDA